MAIINVSEASKQKEKEHAKLKADRIAKRGKKQKARGTFNKEEKPMYQYTAEDTRGFNELANAEVKTTIEGKTTIKEGLPKEIKDNKQKQELIKQYKEQKRETPPQDVYFTPERKKSAQETKDVNTSVDLKQYMKLDNKIPKNIETKHTFRGDEQITKETLRESKNQGFFNRWETNINYQEQELLKGSELKSYEKNKASSEIMYLSQSTESITPTEFKTQIETQSDIIKENQLTIKEASNLLIAPAYFGVARGSKNVLYGVTHPVETVKGMMMLPFNIPEIVSHIAKKGAVNPIGTITELGTELYLWGKVTKTIHRVARPKIIDTPIKAKNIKILETVRKNSKGKVVKDTQVSVTTIKGKPTSRYFWEKAKVQPKTKINVEFQRKGITVHKGGVKQTETLATVKGVVKLADGGNKIKFVPKETTITNKPLTQYNLDTAYTGKTSSGVPIKGKTPRIKPESGVHLTTKITKGYEYIRANNVKGFYKDGEFLTITKQGKVVKVPSKTITKIQTRGTTAYRTKIQKGELVAEIQHSGNFVKRKYIKQKKIIKTDPKITTGIYKDGEFISITTDKATIIKEASKVYKYTESGKLIKTGMKPPSLINQKIIKNIVKSNNQQQVLIMKTSPQKSISKKTSPIVKVITKNVKPKGVSVISPFLKETIQKEETQTNTVYSSEEIFQEEREKQIITPTFKIFETKDNNFKFKVISKEETKSDQLYDSINELDNKNKLDEIIKLKEDVIQEERIITSKEIISDPVIRTEFKEKLVTVPVLLFATETKTEQNKQEIKETGYNVYMYEKNKQVKANVSPLPKQEAERLGRDIADNSLSASYRVTKTNINVPSSKRSRLATGGYVPESKFYESKSKNRKGFFVEKEKNRLDSFGERKGIKASQLISERKNKIKGTSIFGNGNSLFGNNNKKIKRSWF